MEAIDNEQYILQANLFTNGDVFEAGEVFTYYGPSKVRNFGFFQAEKDKSIILLPVINKLNQKCKRILMRHYART